MNVYDFDHTIYPGDSTVDFWKYCLRRWPKAFAALPTACIYGAAFKLHLCDREKFKGQFYRFLCHVPDVKAAASEFWDLSFSRIEEWYLEQQHEDDVVISASPSFLIGEACRRLGVKCIASEVDGKTGKLLSPNCRGEEKVRRFRQEYPDGKVDEFYSDSKSDVYMARLASVAYLVGSRERKEWKV